MAYKECRIKPSAGGFGAYEADESTGVVWDDEGELLDALRDGIAAAELYELGVDDLPDDLEDIRGRIHNEPVRVFGWLDEQGGAQYAGIVQV